MDNNSRLTDDDGLETPSVPRIESWYQTLEDRDAHIGTLGSTLSTSSLVGCSELAEGLTNFRSLTSLLYQTAGCPVLIPNETCQKN